VVLPFDVGLAARQSISAAIGDRAQDRFAISQRSAAPQAAARAMIA